MAWIHCEEVEYECYSNDEIVDFFNGLFTRLCDVRINLAWNCRDVGMGCIDECMGIIHSCSNIRIPSWRSQRLRSSNILRTHSHRQRIYLLLRNYPLLFKFQKLID